MKFPSPGKINVILRRQGEHVEQRIVERNNVENFDSDGNEVKERISEYCKGSSVPRSPCKEKGSMTSLYIRRLSCISKIVELKAGRANFSVSHAVASSRLNGSQRTLFSFEDSFEIDHLFHLKHLSEFLQTQNRFQ
jgi:hypothetical protein